MQRRISDLGAPKQISATGPQHNNYNALLHATLILLASSLSL